ENGEAFFPAVFAAVAAAKRDVILETFILFEDQVGHELHAMLLGAAQRGVQVDVLVDGFGSSDLTPGFIESLTSAGVHFRVFDPRSRVLGIRTNVFRRMHRKIVVVDGALAFVGGINYSADHLADFGPEAKQDYAVEIEGPVVEDIHRFAYSAIISTGIGWRWFQRRVKPLPEQVEQRRAGNASARFVTRDNNDHRTDIERHYRTALRAARKRVVIANAYFFPGYRLLRDIRRAAQRGVTVQLILQGQPDMAIVKFGAEMLYDHLQRAGVRIFEYCERPLHGKVALVDDEWATVGSSNLDPLSLSLNLEANLVIRDRAFNQQLCERLERLIRHSCKEVAVKAQRPHGLWHLVRSAVVFHFLRRFPAWANWLPAHTPRLTMPRARHPAQQAAPKLEHVTERTHVS
ncbi:MAG TPA: cardiolipin synthase ClsB, partial [Rhizobacter sp.]|nr:cardiolipin synthase ClsB [Rhizobacter sp.]